ncbi:MAG: 4-hydroxythreonine-4-phosphate dehydrogenase, partial [Roseicyclus sp.]|nr:4-hydroxythreonine-4-phosphate dehydrogenase [Roseicyclus sp.]
MSAAPPVAVSIGEPAGVGPELAVKAWQRLGSRLPFFVIAEPDHLSGLGVRPVAIDRPADTAQATLSGLPVLPHDFGGPATPGEPAPENAAGVI